MHSKQTFQCSRFSSNKQSRAASRKVARKFLQLPRPLLNACKNTNKVHCCMHTLWLTHTHTHTHMDLQAPNCFQLKETTVKFVKIYRVFSALFAVVCVFLYSKFVYFIVFWSWIGVESLYKTSSVKAKLQLTRHHPQLLAPSLALESLFIQATLPNTFSRFSFECKIT